jgi:hypothetical protein
MEHILYIKQKIDDISREIESSRFDENDLRHSYLDHMFGVFNINYLQWCAIYSASAIEKAVVKQADRVIFDAFLSIVKNDGYFTNTNNSINRGLFLDSWSTFEFFLTYICNCNEILNEPTKTKMLEHDFKKVVKILSRHDLSEEESLKIKGCLVNKHLTHLPVTRKYDKLYSIYKSYYNGNWEEDSEFLAFFGKYRNSMHTNYIYHGVDKVYDILGVRYEFINGQAIRQNRRLHVADMIDLAVKLKSTAMSLFNSIQHRGLLEYPADQIPEV